jgi:hypothetical protein
MPSVTGLIRRRILVNFRVDPRVMSSQIPPRFTPKLHRDRAIAGICLIRLESIRPALLPAAFGLHSENAAHRVAVRWTDDSGVAREGVYVPRRDSGSLLNQIAGGRLFPGEHQPANFRIREDGDQIDIALESRDREVAVRVRGRVSEDLPGGSSFRSLAEASAFFEPGSIGYSATRDGDRLDGVELRTRSWKVEPLEVDEVFSSYFSDTNRFPAGSVEFDCALIMRNIEHEWVGTDDLYV